MVFQNATAEYWNGLWVLEWGWNGTAGSGMVLRDLCMVMWNGGPSAWSGTGIVLEWTLHHAVISISSRRFGDTPFISPHASN